MNSNVSLHLSTARTWRGGENQIYLLARGLRERGQRALVAAPPGSPLLERCRAEKIETRALRIRGGLDLLGAWKLARLLKQERPGILHLHDGHAVIPGKVAAKFCGMKNLKVVAHRRTVFKLKSRGKYSGRIDRVVAISHAVHNELLRAGIPAEKIRVVCSGMDFHEPLSEESPEVRIFREEFKLPPKAFVIAHAAALTSEKRQRDILEALVVANCELQARGVPGMHLAIAGSGVLRDELERLASESDALRSHVHFLGFQKDLRPLWSVSALAVFASEAEGLCTALIEAQGAGLPAAISRAGGMIEVIQADATGVVFEIGAVAELSDTLLALHDDDARRRQMGAKARERARALFSSNAMVDGVLNVYRELTTL